MPETQPLDVVTTSILSAKLEAAVRDMATTLATTAHSNQLSTSRSFGCAILDADGEVVAIDEPLQLPSVQETAAQCLDYYQFDLAADDVIISNDPYGGGSSLHYFLLLAPVEYDDETVAFIATRVHMPDIGGVVMGNYYPLAWELWQEGARFTPLKIVVDGKRRRNAIDTLLLNGRDPGGFRGDMEAALATLSVGRERLRTLMHDHGRETITSAMGSAIAYSERVFRSALQRIPDGRYTGEAVLDHDGLGREDLAVRVALERARDGVILDFAGTEEQSAGFVNSPPANTRAFALLPFLGFVDESIPRNAGFLRALEVRLPEPVARQPRLSRADRLVSRRTSAMRSRLRSARRSRLLCPRRPVSATRVGRSRTRSTKRQRFGGVEEQLGRTDYGTPVAARGQRDRPCGRLGASRRRSPGPAALGRGVGEQRRGHDRAVRIPAPTRAVRADSVVPLPPRP